jgi:hypothetical protein
MNVSVCRRSFMMVSAITVAAAAAAALAAFATVACSRRVAIVAHADRTA